MELLTYIDLLNDYVDLIQERNNKKYVKFLLQLCISFDIINLK